MCLTDIRRNSSPLPSRRSSRSTPWRPAESCRTFGQQHFPLSTAAAAAAACRTCCTIRRTEQRRRRLSSASRCASTPSMPYARTGGVAAGWAAVLISHARSGRLALDLLPPSRPPSPSPLPSPSHPPLYPPPDRRLCVGTSPSAGSDVPTSTWHRPRLLVHLVLALLFALVLALGLALGLALSLAPSLVEDPHAREASAYVHDASVAARRHGGADTSGVWPTSS